MLPDAATSLIAGSIAGAVGVGAAYPLDTIKTKQQIDMEISSNIEYDVSSTGEVSIIAATASSNVGLVRTVLEIWKIGGLGGFYGGVQTSMMGQAVIKATAFGVNAAALDAHYNMVQAAAIAGFITAFLAVPVDRIKVLMQTDCYKTENECFKSVLEKEGLTGLLFTGLVPTLFREVPAYTLYFFLYGTLMSSVAGTLGSIAPAFSGALAGAICVVPVHPVDVVKTIVQHSAAEWQDVVTDIYEGQGFEGFWEGLIPRMGRAAVNHAVTFAVYDFIVHKL
jgi:solute carrier family 25 carnitine/acylcarnitine transporter 20/29